MNLQLSECIKCAIEQTLDDRIAVSFSGGLDSTTIATVARTYGETELFTAGTEKSDDITHAEKIATTLKLPLTKVMLDEKKIIDSYKKCHKLLGLDFLKLGILVPVYVVAEEAKRKGHKIILFGSGTEELFIGYDRYYRYAKEGKNLDKLVKEEFRSLPQKEISWVKQICGEFGMEARFPFYNKELADIVFAVPIEERMEDKELKKGLLREAAKFLGVPELALKRKKKAMQYGSGVHKVLLKHSKELQQNNEK
ncbi:asparagine synthase [Candidatus Micrarchaeota archaeon]|nr:asparagine synthase [Candidatus Micrarchaeota archaeon]